jgi:hypothetical protein
MRGLVAVVFLSLAACATPLEVAGLRPLSPEPYSHPPKLKSLQPELRWEAFPRPMDLKEDQGGWVSRVRHVTYDLRIWRGSRDPNGYQEVYPAELVYSRTALAAPEHTVETPLEHDTQYLWSVRARFEIDGQQRVTPWSVLLQPGQSEIDDPRSMSVPSRRYYRFATP